MADIELSTADPATLAAIRAALGTPDAARTLRFPDAEVSPPSPVLPDIATREGMLLGFAAGGAPAEVDPSGFGGGIGSIAAEILAATPYSYWKLDESSGTAIADSSGNGRNATIAGTYTLAQTGPDGGASSISFAAARITAGSVWNHSDFSCMAWIYPTFSNPGHAPTLFAQRSASANRVSFHVSIARDGIESWDGASVGTLSLGDHLKLDGWRHVAIVRSATLGKYLCYVNGVFRGSAGRTLSATTTEPLAFGATSGAYAEPWIGRAAHLAYFNRLLTETEIRRIYNAVL